MSQANMIKTKRRPRRLNRKRQPLIMRLRVASDSRLEVVRVILWQSMFYIGFSGRELERPRRAEERSIRKACVGFRAERRGCDWERRSLFWQPFPGRPTVCPL